jgi:hypothetical protein
VREIPEYTKKSQLGDDDSVTQRNSGPALVNLSGDVSKPQYKDNSKDRQLTRREQYEKAQKLCLDSRLEHLSGNLTISP